MEISQIQNSDFPAFKTMKYPHIISMQKNLNPDKNQPNFSALVRFFFQHKPVSDFIWTTAQEDLLKIESPTERNFSLTWFPHSENNIALAAHECYKVFGN